MITHNRSWRWLLTAALATLWVGVAPAATIELTGPEGATISLNDRPLGQFPLAESAVDVPPGRYTIRCELQGYTSYEQAVGITNDQEWRRLSVRMVPLSKGTAWRSNILLAGLGQHYVGHSFRGYVYNVAEVGGLLTALAGELQRSDLEKEYLKLVDLYGSSINADEITELRNTADKKYSDMKDMEELRDLGLMVAGGAILVSIADVLLTFPAATAGGGTVPLATSSLETPWSEHDSDHSLHAGLRLTF
ncbi:MAG: hypothetical protein ACI9UK_002063 [Candidatus Krumholzibacteriia bacterium]|jgi:hypothetical protein